MTERDVVLEGVRPLDLEQLQLLASGSSATASPQQLARIEAKGWLETVGGAHLITLTGRALLERPPVQLS
ncbi:hypothetical protein JI749_05930 [Devosia oryziradicis]|uniref:Winged helix-turn-helix domain-containing protein n=1 Tax=Devosia oryziradicis TaxID=2801335 RepID=A0ABX7C3A2_9HYPH|nr:hypothetical protein [Devosia oryziradicis]QQR37150.1 hypothetical protein JI749_05930 [Devosia oryziradicis]